MYDATSYDYYVTKYASSPPYELRGVTDPRLLKEVGDLNTRDL